MNASWRSTTPASTRASTILRHWCPFQPMPQSSIHWLQSMLWPIIAQRTDVRKRPCRVRFAAFYGGLTYNAGRALHTSPPHEGLGRSRDRSLRPRKLHERSINKYPCQWYRYHSDGMHSFAMDWTGIHYHPVHRIPMDGNRLLSAEGDWPEKTTNESGGCSLQCRQRQITWR